MIVSTQNDENHGAEIKCHCAIEDDDGGDHKIEDPILEINTIRLNLFTERNSDGTGYLMLRGKDIHDRFQRRICDKDIRAIATYVIQSPRRITRLDVSYNDISDFGFHKFLRLCLIDERSNLTNLNIMNNRLSEVSMMFLLKYAKDIKLQGLRLNGNKIGTKGGEYFALFLRKNASLLCTDIGETDLTLSCIACIITALRTDHGRNRTLKVLDLSRIIPLFNGYQYETKWLAYHIEFLLVYNCTLIELHLQKNQLGGHDMEYLIRGLRKNKALLYLDLGFNRLGNYGTELLAKYLSEGPQLIFLNLAGNGIANIGASAISHGMPFSRIRALDISHNQITDEGMLEILKTLRKPFYLRFLNIWGNKFGHETCAVIDRMLYSGVLFRHTIDVRVYEVDGVLHAAYYCNPADRNKHLYYCELEFAEAQPILQITRNDIPRPRQYKVDCKQRRKLDKTDQSSF